MKSRLSIGTCCARLLVATCLLSLPTHCLGELLVFSAPWCRACRLMDTTEQRLLDEGYPIRVVNVDQEPEMAQRFKIRGVPTLILVRDNREVRRAEGPQSYAQLREWFFQDGYDPSDPPPRPAAARDTTQRQIEPPPSPRARTTPAAHPAPRVQAPQTDLGRDRSDIDAVQRAQSASVRLKVDDETGHSYGSGTIIDVHEQHALVLTCGHIFRESQGKGPIHVDLFASGTPQTVEGQLVRHDLKEDVALVSIPLPAPIDPVPVATHVQRIRPQDRVFSVGCDHGADPSVNPSQIVDINRYLGSENLVVKGHPIDGRSGGGLFDERGELIGVCNAADHERDEGLFASLPVVHRILDRSNLSQVYQRHVPRGPMMLASNTGAATRAPNARTAVTPPRPTTDERASNERNSNERASNEAASNEPASDTEIICILRSRQGSPQAQHEVIVLASPSAEILTTLRREGRPSHETPTLMR